MNDPYPIALVIALQEIDARLSAISTLHRLNGMFYVARLASVDIPGNDEATWRAGRNVLTELERIGQLFDPQTDGSAAYSIQKTIETWKKKLLNRYPTLDQP